MGWTELCQQLQGQWATLELSKTDSSDIMQSFCMEETDLSSS